MSPIGRIFIVLNLILSAAFLGWASNAIGTTKNFKEEIAKLNKDHEAAIAAKDAEIAKVNADLGVVTEEKRQLREGRDAATAESDRVKTQLEELKRAGDTMQANLTKIQATLGDYNSTIAQLTSQKDAAIERAHEAERQSDAAKTEKQAAELAKNAADERASNADLKIGDLEKDKIALAERVSTLETRLVVYAEKTGVALNEVEATPKIDAYVLEVNRDLKLVVLNRGKKDNVKTGYTFSIYKGTQYKGQVRIQDVQETMSSGVIVAEKASIAKGDSATTNL